MAKKKNTKNIRPEESEEEEEGTFHVELFKKVRSAETRGEWQYYVKWANYPEHDCTWEPETHVANCTRLLDSFWKHLEDIHNVSKTRWEPDLELEPSEEWMEKEKDFFQTEFEREQAEQEKKRERPKEAKKRKASSESSSKAKSKVVTVSSDSEDDTPLMNLSTSKNKKASVSDDDSDTPMILGLKRKGGSSESTFAKKPKLDIPKRDIEKDNAVGRDLFPESASASPVTSTPREMGSASSFKPSKSVVAPPRIGNITPQSNAQSPVFTGQKSAKVGTTLSTKARLSEYGSTIMPANAKSLPKFNKVPQSTSTNATPVAPTAPSPVLPLSIQPQAPPGSGDTLRSTGTAPSTTPGSTPRIAPPRPGHIQKTPVAQDRQTNLNIQAEKLLQEIMPPEMRSEMDVPMPLESPVDILPPQASLTSTAKSGTTALPKIMKKWTWTGDLYWGPKSSEAKPNCQVILEEPSKPRQTNRLELRWVFDNNRQFLVFEKLYNNGDIDLLAPMWQPVQQFAKLTPAGYSGELRTLAEYMSRKHKFACSPVELDGAVKGHLVLFSSESSYFRSRFRPATAYKECLILALLLLKGVLLKEEGKKLKPQEWRVPISQALAVPDYPSPLEDASQWDSLAKRRPEFSRAIRVLKFPKRLYAHLRQPNRSFSVWDARSDKAVFLDTHMILSVLKETGAKRVEHSLQCRVVFIHVGALKVLSSHPALQLAQSNPEIDYYIYGTHPSAPKSLWGVRNIFPLGGIVTFTPEFLARRPVSALDIIRKVSEHQLWMAYILPSVLGRAAQLACKSENPLNVFDRGRLLIHGILQAVEEGIVGVLRAPSAYPHDGQNQWIHEQLSSSNSQTRDILAKAMDALNSLGFKDSDIKLTEAVRQELVTDLRRMRIEPGIITNYRRFVIISEDLRGDAGKDGLEWLPVEKFSFGDDYFTESATNS